MFFFTVRTFLCAPSGNKFLVFLFFFASLFQRMPLVFCMPYLVRLSLISFFNVPKNLAISSQVSWIAFWLAMTSHKPISLTARLAVNPNLKIQKSLHSFFAASQS